LNQKSPGFIILNYIMPVIQSYILMMSWLFRKDGALPGIPIHINLPGRWNRGDNIQSGLNGSLMAGFPISG
jgi:hypothetical protein